MCDHLRILHVLQHRKQFPLLRRPIHCGIHMLTSGKCHNHRTPRFKKRRSHGELVQEGGNEQCIDIPKIRAMWIQVGNYSQQM